MVLSACSIHPLLRCERYVGTEGGGMDQAVSVMAQQGAALHVEFNPVSGQVVDNLSKVLVTIQWDSCST